MVDDEASFDAYVRGRAAALNRVAYLLTSDHHLSEDLVQQSLIVVAARWERIIAGGNPDPYVRKVLYHQYLSWRRARRLVELLGMVPDRPVADPNDGTPDVVLVRRALARLAPRQRAALVLRFFEDLTEAETADVLGCSVSTVKTHVRTGLTRLRSGSPDLAHLRPEPQLGPDARLRSDSQALEVSLWTPAE